MYCCVYRSSHYANYIDVYLFDLQGLVSEENAELILKRYTYLLIFVC